jgi:glycosyltransferase involved in cell wall biosynthesis
MTAGSNPLVTVAMTVRNAQDTLAMAIASISAQTHRDWELVIVDDGSSDASMRIAERAAGADPRIRTVHHPESRGIASRLNAVLQATSSPLFARMDADDVAYPSRLERQLAYLDEHPEVDVVGSAMVVFGGEGRAIGKRLAPREHDQICARPHDAIPLFHPTWLGRVEWFRRWGYAPEAVRCEDWDLLYRAHRSSTFANLPEALMGYRDELVLRDILVSRAKLAPRAARDLWFRGERLAAAATLSHHAAKGLLDAVAITTGLNHRILPQRAGPMSVAELAEWRVVWSSVRSAEAIARYSELSSPRSVPSP